MTIIWGRLPGPLDSFLAWLRATMPPVEHIVFQAEDGVTRVLAPREEQQAHGTVIVTWEGEHTTFADDPTASVTVSTGPLFQVMAIPVPGDRIQIHTLHFRSTEQDDPVGRQAWDYFQDEVTNQILLLKLEGIPSHYPDPVPHMQARGLIDPGPFQPTPPVAGEMPSRRPARYEEDDEARAACLAGEDREATYTRWQQQAKRHNRKLNYRDSFRKLYPRGGCGASDNGNIP